MGAVLGENGYIVKELGNEIPIVEGRGEVFWLKPGGASQVPTNPGESTRHATAFIPGGSWFMARPWGHNAHTSAKTFEAKCYQPEALGDGIYSTESADWLEVKQEGVASLSFAPMVAGHTAEAMTPLDPLYVDSVVVTIDGVVGSLWAWRTHGENNSLTRFEHHVELEATAAESIPIHHFHTCSETSVDGVAVLAALTDVGPSSYWPPMSWQFLGRKAVRLVAVYGGSSQHSQGGTRRSWHAIAQEKLATADSMVAFVNNADPGSSTLEGIERIRDHIAAGIRYDDVIIPGFNTNDSAEADYYKPTYVTRRMREIEEVAAEVIATGARAWVLCNKCDYGASGQVYANFLAINAAIRAGGRRGKWYVFDFSGVFIDETAATGTWYDPADRDVTDHLTELGTEKFASYAAKCYRLAART